MEQKKQLLIVVLNKLKSYRDLAEGVLALLKSGYADEKAIDGIIQLIANSIKTVKTDQQKTVLQKGLEIVQKIKDMEECEKISEEELDNLLADI